MKKQIYFAGIGIGAVLAIVGFIPGGISWLWGILIAGISGALYVLNTKNEQKVQERLDEETGMFQRNAEKEATAPETDDASDEKEQEPDE